MAPKKKEKKPIALLIFLAATLIIGIAAGFFLTRSNQPEPVRVLSPLPSTEETTAPMEKTYISTEPAVTSEPVVTVEAPMPTEDVPIPTEQASTEASEPAATEENREPLIYDDRKAEYAGQDPQWETLHFEWENQNGIGTMQLDILIDREMYLYYRNLERYYNVENFYLYTNDENNREIVRNIVSSLRNEARSLFYDDAAVAREIAKFVQDSVEYQYDSDSTGQEEYPRYPIETLYERQGDCEDTSILMAALLKEWGYEVGFLHLPSHVAVAIRTADDYNGSSYYEIDGHRYLFIESTASGWNIGDIPTAYQETAAQFYPIP